MAQYTQLLTSRLARAARALVGTSAAHTAEASGLTRQQLRDFEKGRAALSPDERIALRTALEGLGAVFLADGPKGRGYGVRLKFSRVGKKRVEAWEDEGGRPGDDDA